MYTLYHSDNIPGTNFNRTMTKFPELDKTIEDMNAESDKAKRQSAVRNRAAVHHG